LTLTHYRSQCVLPQV